MPRPPFKRTKLAHPRSPKRVSKHATTSTRLDLQKKLEGKKVGAVSTDSDDSDKLVTALRKGKHNQYGVGRREIYGSGGVATQDIPDAHNLSLPNMGTHIHAPVPRKATSKRQGIDTLAAQKTPETAANTFASTSKAKQPITGSKPIEKSTPSLANRKNTVNTSRPLATPGLDVSILGKIAPRRRQPSILQVVNNNSSGITDGDEEVNDDDFLPNDESTPIAVVSVGGSWQRETSLTTSSRKRKLSPPILQHCQPSAFSPEHRNGLSSSAWRSIAASIEPELPPMIANSTFQPRKAASTVTNGDIMAPPMSSSPAPSPRKQQTAPQARKQRQGKNANKSGISTSTLKNLLPNRRAGSRRAARNANPVFDIPVDTDEEVVDKNGPIQSASDEGESSFDARRNKKGSRSTMHLRPPGKPRKKRDKGAALGGKSKETGRGQGKKSSTSTNPIKVAPLEHSTTECTAKNSSQRPDGTKPKRTYSRRGKEVEDEKENQPNASLELSSPLRSIEESSFEPHSNRAINPTSDTALWQQKFGEVDDWQMEFEDVTIDGIASGSSSQR